MNTSTPSSTSQTAGVAAFIAATLLLIVKIVWPEVYHQIPAEYQGYLIGAISFFFSWQKKENVYKMEAKK